MVGRFFSELKERNVIRVGGVYAVTAWALFQVAKTVMETLSLPKWAPALVLVILTLGLPIAMIIAFAFERGPDGKVQRTPDKPADAPRARLGLIDWSVLAGVLVVLAISGLQVAGVIGRGRTAAPSAAPSAAPAAGESVAVLPFNNFSERQDAEYFADGLTEEVINSLAQIPGLKVAGRTSAFYFKGKNEDLREIGRRLGVSHVVEGSVRREADRLRVTAQLIKVSDGFHVWSQTYDRQMSDGFAIQTEIANSVANTLRLKLEPSAAASDQNRDPEAYRLELVARAEMRRLGLDQLTAARNDYAKLIKLEPDNADAYAGYASATALLAQNHLALDFPSAEAEARAAIAKAMALNPNSPGPYIAQGLLCQVLIVRSDNQPCIAQGEAAFRKAVDLAPKNADALVYYGDVLARRSPRDAADYLKRAVTIDPLNRLGLNSLAQVYAATGQLGEAERLYLSTIGLYPDFVDAKQELGGLYVRQGRLDRAEPWLKAAAAPATDPSAAIELAALYLNLNMPREADAALAPLAAHPFTADIVRAIRLVVGGDYKGLKALAQSRLRNGSDPIWRSTLTIAAVLTGDNDGARQQMLVLSPELFEPTPTVNGRLASKAVLAALICQRLGDNGQARRILMAMLAQTAPTPGRSLSPDQHVDRARVYAVLGDKEQALKELRAGIDGGYRYLVGFEYFLRLDRDPMLQPLWPDPRFRAMLAEVAADNERMRRALAGPVSPVRQASL